MTKNQNYSEEQKQFFKDRAGTDEAWYHVVPHEDKGWAVKAEGKDEPEYSASAKSEVVDEAKRLAENSGTMVIVHDDDGKIENQYNFQQEK